LVIVASFGAGASADLTNYLPGGFSAVSNTFFSLTASISEIPVPQPSSAAAIPTMLDYALMLLAMLVAAIGIARGKAHF
jgi:hypothetical protein